MGNCLKRNRSNERSSSEHFMGFRVVNVDNRTEISKAISRCKKRKSFRNSDSITKRSLKGINDKINNIFDYEEPLDILDDKEVRSFIKAEQEESEAGELFIMQENKEE